MLGVLEPLVIDTRLVQGDIGENITHLFDRMSKEDLVAFSGACVHSSLLLYDLIRVHRRLGRYLADSALGSELRFPFSAPAFLIGSSLNRLSQPSQ